MRPSIIITEMSEDNYQVVCTGKFGGGYQGRFGRQQAISMLARDGRNYDCGNEPILIVAPADIKVSAGFVEV